MSFAIKLRSDERSRLQAFAREFNQYANDALAEHIIECLSDPDSQLPLKQKNALTQCVLLTQATLKKQKEMGWLYDKLTIIVQNNEQNELLDDGAKKWLSSILVDEDTLSWEACLQSQTDILMRATDQDVELPISEVDSSKPDSPTLMTLIQSLIFMSRVNQYAVYIELSEQHAREQRAKEQFFLTRWWNAFKSRLGQGTQKSIPNSPVAPSSDTDTPLEADALMSDRCSQHITDTANDLIFDLFTKLNYQLQGKKDESQLWRRTKKILVIGASVFILATALFEVLDGVATILGLLSISTGPFIMILGVLAVLGMIAFVSFELTQFFQESGVELKFNTHESERYKKLRAINDVVRACFVHSSDIQDTRLSQNDKKQILKLISTIRHDLSKNLFYRLNRYNTESDGVSYACGSENKRYLYIEIADESGKKERRYLDKLSDPKVLEGPKGLMLVSEDTQYPITFDSQKFIKVSEIHKPWFKRVLFSGTGLKVMSGIMTFIVSVIIEGSSGYFIGAGVITAVLSGLGISTLPVALAFLPIACGVVGAIGLGVLGLVVNYYMIQRFLSNIANDKTDIILGFEQQNKDLTRMEQEVFQGLGSSPSELLARAQRAEALLEELRSAEASSTAEDDATNALQSLSEESPNDQEQLHSSNLRPVDLSQSGGGSPTKRTGHRRDGSWQTGDFSAQSYPGAPRSGRGSGEIYTDTHRLVESAGGGGGGGSAPAALDGGNATLRRPRESSMDASAGASRAGDSTARRQLFPGS